MRDDSASGRVDESQDRFLRSVLEDAVMTAYLVSGKKPVATEVVSRCTCSRTSAVFGGVAQGAKQP